MGFDVSMERVPDEERGSKSPVTAPASSEKLMSVTPHEEKLVVSYREQPAMQGAVDKLLGIEDDSKIRPAKQNDFFEPEENESPMDFAALTADAEVFEPIETEDVL